MLPKTYIETTIVSYLAARPSSQPAARVHQDITREWWTWRRSRFELYVSEVVLDEASRGNDEAAAARLAVIESLPILAPRRRDPARVTAHTEIGR